MLRRSEEAHACVKQDCIVRLERVTKRYCAPASGFFNAVDRVSLTFRRGEFVAIMGASGSGKSTLLHMMGGIDRPTSGTVEICGTDIYSLRDKELAAFRCEQIGMIFQFFNLIPVLNIVENIAFPAMAAGKRPDLDEAEHIALRLGLPYRVFSNLPNQLSGGQQQRVAIGRALLQRPALLLADEPTGNLDSQNSEAVLEMLQSMRNEIGTTLIVVTHDPKIAAKADRIVHLEDGRVVEDSIEKGAVQT